MRTLTRSRTGAAFTLIELLVVAAVISVLASLLLPAMHTAKVRAQATLCSSNLRQFGVAALAYTADHGRLPPMLEWLYDLESSAEGDATTGRFYQYVRSRRVYLCPAQPGTVVHPGWAPTITPYPADHNYLMNCMSCHAHDISAARTPARTLYMVEALNLPNSRYGSLATPLPTGQTALFTSPGFPHGKRGNVLMFDGHAARLRPQQLPAGNAAPDLWYPNEATGNSGAP